MRGWEADSRGLSKSDISRFTEQWNQVRVNEIINDLWVTGTRVQVRFSDGIWSVWRTDTCSTSWLSLFLLKQERKKREKSHRKSFCVWVSDGNRVNERIKDEKLVLKNVHKPQERKMWNVKQEMSLRSDKIKDSVWHFLVSVVEATRTQLTQIDCEWD